ncbi:hypothetical protein PE067_18630 [Paracoccus sp. DMF-8]|uniref:hypothetical protein n=1 Tax=Paracoccus sp. DMF-8 TaxID=3019445 RepID=UPI0023E3CA46|nr:hypothetical protein [Paracoccus sp. DMF-8]MDF3607966.1 hypothetical protein [Paracoccus sp. DMF-8]
MEFVALQTGRGQQFARGRSLFAFGGEKDVTTGIGKADLAQRGQHFIPCPARDPA